MSDWLKSLLRWQGRNGGTRNVTSFQAAHNACATTFDESSCALQAALLCFASFCRSPSADGASILVNAGFKGDSKWVEALAQMTKQSRAQAAPVDRLLRRNSTFKPLW